MRRSAGFCAILLMLATTGCRKEAAPPTTEPLAAQAPVVPKESKPIAAEPPPAASPTVAPTPTPPPVPTANVELTVQEDAAFGYTVRLPKGAKELAKDDMAQTYSLTLPDGANELNLHLTHAGATSLDDAVATATMMGSKSVIEKQEMGTDGWLVVKAPQGPIQEVWVFRKGKTTPVTAKCTGPATALGTLKLMCTSLVATK